MKIKPVMSQSYFPRMPCLIRSCNDVRSALGWKNLFASANSLDICQSWAYWKTEKYLLTTKYQLHECTNCTWGLLGHGDSAWTQNWEPWSLSVFLASLVLIIIHAASRGTNLLFSPFDYCVKSEFQFGSLPLERVKFRKEDQIFLINIFL